MGWRRFRCNEKDLQEVGIPVLKEQSCPQQKAFEQSSEKSRPTKHCDKIWRCSCCHHYASQLPFRAGAKPIIILLSCDECSQSSQVTVPQVQAQLERSGISFHHFNMQPITVSSPKVFGYNKDFGFDSSSNEVQTLTRSETDQCAVLATNAGGSV